MPLAVAVVTERVEVREQRAVRRERLHVAREAVVSAWIAFRKRPERHLIERDAIRLSVTFDLLMAFLEHDGPLHGHHLAGLYQRRRLLPLGVRDVVERSELIVLPPFAPIRGGRHPLFRVRSGGRLLA